MKKSILIFCAGVILIVFLLPGHVGVSLPKSLNLNFAAKSSPTQSLETYSLQGPPTVSADFINKVLAYYGSPAQGQGQAFYDLGIQYGIDPVYALAWFNHESSFGRTGEAGVTLSIGNERPSNDDMACTNDGCYQAYPSWSAGINHWYWQMEQYVNGNIYITVHGYRKLLLTVNQVVPTWAPPSDGNDDSAYICAIKNAVLSWREGHIAIRKLVC